MGWAVLGWLVGLVWTDLCCLGRAGMGWAGLAGLSELGWPGLGEVYWVGLCLLC